MPSLVEFQQRKANGQCLVTGRKWVQTSVSAEMWDKWSLTVAIAWQFEPIRKSTNINIYRPYIFLLHVCWCAGLEENGNLVHDDNQSLLNIWPLMRLSKTLSLQLAYPNPGRISLFALMKYPFTPSIRSNIYDFLTDISIISPNIGSLESMNKPHYGGPLSSWKRRWGTFA